MVYVVQRNDTPASIAARFGQNSANALIQVNPQKARQVVHGDTTFRSLNIGERLNVPNTWLGRSNGSGTMSGFGLGDTAADVAALQALNSADLCNGNGQSAIIQFQQDYNATGAGTLTVSGVYDQNTANAAQATLNQGGGGTAPTACGATPTPTPASGGAITNLQNAANAVIADSTICNGQVNANVQAFQTAYNIYTNSTITVDGKYGPTSAAAMADTSQTSGITLTGSLPPACSIYSGSTQAPPSGGGSTTTTTTTTSSTTVSATSSATPWIVAAVAAVAGAGVFYLMKKHPTAVHKAHKKLVHHARHMTHHRLAHR